VPPPLPRGVSLRLANPCQRPFDMWNLSGRVYQNVLAKADLAKVLKIGYYKEGQVMLGNQAAVLHRKPDPTRAASRCSFFGV